MKIARVAAKLLHPRVPITTPGIERTVTRELLLVEAETADGRIGYGVTGLAPAKAVMPLINDVAAPLILGMDARRIGEIWNALYRELGQRGQTGIASHAISAIDIALWDLRGKALGEPVWQLLGGARDRVPCYVTCGLPSFDIDELVAVAKYWVSEGFSGLKIVAGALARSRPDDFASPKAALREDARRIKAVREAVGEDIDIAIDINCELDFPDALAVTRMCRPYDLAFVEEPVMGNHPRRLADFRRQTDTGIATGQSIGSLARFGELLALDAVDMLQPNVINCGGYTGGLRVADLALAFEVPICNGGGSTVHNMHLQAGAINGTACEWHPYQSAGAAAVVFPGAPVPEGGNLTLPDRPGLGFDPDPDAVKEFTAPRT